MWGGKAFHYMLEPEACKPRRLVLDTQVLLDLWLFHDPRVAKLRNALQCGQVVALMSAATTAEWQHLLARPAPDGWKPSWKSALAFMKVTAIQGIEWVDGDIPTAPGLICTDRSDQKFVDLAWHGRANGLLSRDRAVLRLAAKARRLGLWIGSPLAWEQAHA
jgi:uncharacterized protein